MDETTGPSTAREPGEPSDQPPVVPSLDTRWFRHELTPTWLSTAAVLAGVRPFDLDQPFRVAWLGCDARFTPAVAAAVHPGAEVLVWDPTPQRLHAVRRLGTEADLTNLAVHEEPDPPAADGERFDLVVLDGILDSVDDELRAAVVESTSALLRPGGLAVAAYRTVVGWSEIAPVVHLVRHLALTGHRDHASSVADAQVLLGLLDERGARYLAERPVVRAWLRDLLELKADEIVEHYVHRPLRPISHAQVTEALAARGISYVGSARMDGEVPAGLSADLTRQLKRTGSPILRRSLVDIAVRRDRRIDLFGLGPLPEAPRVRSRTVQNLRLTALAPADTWPDDTALGSEATARLVEGSVPVKDLWPELKPARREQELRRVLSAGLVHPMPDAEPDRTVHQAASRLSEAMTSPQIPTEHRHLAAPAIATAVPAADADSPGRRLALGIDRP